MANPTAAKSLSYISKNIYSASIEGIPTAVLLWHPTTSVVDEGGFPEGVAVLHTVSQFLTFPHNGTTVPFP